MKPRWLRSLALSLGILVTGQSGPFLTLAQSAETSAPVFHRYPPIEQPATPSTPDPTPPAPAENDDPAPAATLDRPIALREDPPRSDPPRVDKKVQTTGLFSGRNPGPFVSNPGGSAFGSARPMPLGSSTDIPLPAPSPLLGSPPQPDLPTTWRQPPTASSSSSSGSSTAVAPMPGAVGVPGPSSSTVIAPGLDGAPIGAPIGAPLGDTCGGDVCDAPVCGDVCCGDVCCGDGCCGLWGGCNRGCCFNNRWYASAEYLLWFIRGQSLPPLLTTGPITSSPPGAIGQPGTAVLFGNSNFANNPYSGARLRAGYWFNDCHGWGLDLGGFFLGSTANQFTASSIGSPFLARPFFNALTNAQDIEAVASPNGLTGTFTALNTFLLYGAEANLRRNLFCGCNWFIDGFAGWRLLGMNESLTLGENLFVASSTNPNLPVGSRFIVSDRFRTNNLFNGAQIGGIGEYRLGRWFADVRASVALGGTMQVVNIAGSTTAAAPGSPATTSQGGLLALSSNIGSYSRGMVSMVDEIGINLGYQFTNHIRGFVGYNFLYWTSVVRPGNQIDFAVNPNLIPGSQTTGGPARPAFNFNGSDFWVQGIQFGLDIRW